MKVKNKKGVVFIFLGIFTIMGLFYLFTVFLDLFNVMYAKTVFQGHARSSSLHAANFININTVDSRNHDQDYIVINSSSDGTLPVNLTAEYNAKYLFDLNYRNLGYSLVKGGQPDDYIISANNPSFKVRVYNLTKSGSGYIPAPETIHPKYSGIIHNSPGVAVYNEVKLKSWTIFFDEYTIHSYSYSSPIRTD